MKLQNQVAIITGGTSGIGRAAAELFAAEGARVVITGRRQALGEAAASQFGGRYIQADHRSPANCARCVEETIAAFGRVDILFNNAGIVPQGTAETTSEADWQETLDINVTAVWRMARLVIPHMRRQGKGVIINNASDWAFVGAPNVVAYCTSKGAVVQMTRAMAMDHARDGIRINAICPGDTIVERWAKDGYYRNSGAVNPQDALKDDNIPLGRVAEPIEIARAVLFLACDDSSYMTGGMLTVDGGNTAR